MRADHNTVLILLCNRSRSWEVQAPVEQDDAVGVGEAVPVQHQRALLPEDAGEVLHHRAEELEARVNDHVELLRGEDLAP